MTPLTSATVSTRGKSTIRLRKITIPYTNKTPTKNRRLAHRMADPIPNAPSGPADYVRWQPIPPDLRLFLVRYGSSHVNHQQKLRCFVAPPRDVPRTHASTVIAGVLHAIHRSTYLQGCVMAVSLAQGTVDASTRGVRNQLVFSALHLFRYL